MTQRTITTTVNGEVYTRVINVNMTLVEFLRDELNLKGTKEGCDEGECGACTIIFDGHPFNSCLVLAVEAHGHEITTIEGIAKSDKLHPIQEAFLEVGAVQCGYCTPGMVLSAKVVLDEFANPTEEQIRTGIEGNICRCTGYNRIVAAIQLAAEKINDVGAAE
jgi:aerobic-type carbon monoxide dehydrogenase small subunit (CoxS/CutS family)